jgi:hypothetical protein
MKIPSQLPQFEDERALLVVATRQTAAIHAAHDGQLQTLARIDVPTPVYSDNEGFFTRSGNGMRMGSGSVRELKKEHIQQEFLKLFKPAITEAVTKTKADAIYLFVPAHRVNETIEAFPYRTKRLLARTVRGNFSHYSLPELLARIQERSEVRAKEKARSVTPPKARAILKKSKKARKVIRG